MKDFRYPCKFKYDEERKGDTKHGGGFHIIRGRCLLRSGDKKCLFPEKDHMTCTFSIHPRKKQPPNTHRFKGKWKKR